MTTRPLALVIRRLHPEAMTVPEVIAKHPHPITRAMIAEACAAAGLRSGDTVLAHAAMSAFGYVVGGEVALVQGVLDALGPDGTILVPAFSSDLSEPSHWRNPPVPEDWWPILRAEAPAFDPTLTPTWNLGRFPDAVRRWPGARRSMHPKDSFAAFGPQAEHLLGGQRLEAAMGEESPLARLVDLQGKVMFLGSGFKNATIFHLGEHRAGFPEDAREGSPMLVNGARQWVEYATLDYDSDDFDACGAAFEATGAVTAVPLGASEIRLFDAGAAVAFSAQWLRANRAPA